MTNLPILNEIFYNITHDQENIRFYSLSGKLYHMHHDQDCCETVEIDDLNGNLDNLLDSPILYAVEKTNKGTADEGESITWTFYTIRTHKGSVDITWKGESNGYYSEDVDFEISDCQVPTDVFQRYAATNPEWLL